MSEENLLMGLSVAALFVAVVAAIYTYLAYRLKSGIEIRGSFSIVSSRASNDRYVRMVTLENVKDRAVIIFKIYLEVGYGYYIEIDVFEDQPLILKPFEAFTKDYDPIDLYVDNMRRIDMDKLLAGRKTRRRLVLSTSQGRYNVTHHVDRWDPVSDYFRNQFTGVITPLRTTYEGRAYGSGTKYVLRLVAESGETEIFPIYPRDHEVKKFRGFQLTAESLLSREALEMFLLERVVAGELRCSNLEVFDLDEWRRQAYEEYENDSITAVPRGWFTYRVLGWIITKWRELKRHRTNRDNQKRYRAALKAKGRAPSRKGV